MLECKNCVLLLVNRIVLKLLNESGKYDNFQLHIRELIIIIESYILIIYKIINDKKVIAILYVNLRPCM